MSFKRLRLRWVALLMGVACLIIVLTVPFGSNRWSTGIQVLGVQSAIVPITVLLSATNRSSHDYAFSCFLEIRNKSGWSDVTPSDELRTLRYFRKGQVVQLNVGLGPKEAVYRFHCGCWVMRKVNTTRIKEITWSSPKGKFVGAGKEISEELGRQPASTDLNERHPFDVEICRIPPGKTPYPYHAHSAQWEFYHVISGTGVVRHKGGTVPIETGDAFIFKPGEAHQITNNGAADLLLYVVADNPVGESYYYPDSNKWSVPIPERRVLRSDALDYYDGEE